MREELSLRGGGPVRPADAERLPVGENRRGDIGTDGVLIQNGGGGDGPKGKGRDASRFTTRGKATGAIPDRVPSLCLSRCQTSRCGRGGDADASLSARLAEGILYDLHIIN